MKKYSALLLTVLIATVALTNSPERLTDSPSESDAPDRIKTAGRSPQYTPLDREGDSCQDPIVAYSLPYQFIGTTVDNSDTYGHSAPDEWHQFTLTDVATVFIDLCSGNTDYYTYIYLLSDDCLTELAQCGTGDDCPQSPAPHPPSQLEIDLPAGTYLLAVEGVASYAGNYGLLITTEEIEHVDYYSFQTVHTPDDSWSAGTSHNNGDGIDYLRADRFGESGEITALQVFGLRLTCPAGWSPCTEDPMSFAVTFYEDGMIPGAAVCNYLLEVSPEATGDLFANFQLFEFNLDLPTPCDLTQGWVSVQSYSYCYFLWMSGCGADGMSALSRDGGAWGTYDSDFDLAYVLTTVEGVAEIDNPNSMVLSANHPNPFNPVTTISYELIEPQQVELSVFNISGEKVATLVSGTQSAGEHTVEFNGSNLPGGIYFYLLTTGEDSQSNRMLLVK
jgi:hypothetical protein